MTQDWKRLGELLAERRVQVAGHANRSRFAKDHGLPNDRVLYDIEKGRRSNYEPGTLSHIRLMYQLDAEAIERALSGGDLVVRPSGQTAGHDDRGDLLYQQPEGISDAEWERIRERSRAYIDGLIDGVARER